MKAILAILATLAVSTSLWAFGKPGHMTTGSVAYQILNEESPESVQKIVALLEKHPFVNGSWKKKINATSPDGVSRAERLFMLAASWPDEVRSKKWSERYHRPDWHYINYPYYSETEKTGDPMAGQLIDQLTKNLRAARNPTLADEKRALAICWVIHLVGDLHQPLHVVAIVDSAFPKGDRGGNKFYVRPGESSAPKSLHKIWDDQGRVLDPLPSGFLDVRKRAAALIEARLGAIKSSSGLVAADRFADIARRESYPLAVKYAYLDGDLDGATEAAMEEEPDEVSVVPEGYLDQVSTTCDEQLVLAGYRISQLFRTGF